MELKAEATEMAAEETASYAEEGLLGRLRRRCFCSANTGDVGEGSTASPTPPTEHVKEPDPMHALIWYETAFIFGCLSPLMVLLVAAQLYADAIAFEWKLRRAPSTTMPRWWGAEPLPILRRVLKAHLVLVLFLQSAMIVFFFVENKLGGWQMVAAVVPAVFVGDLLFSLQKVMYRWRESSRRSDDAASIRMPRDQPSPLHRSKDDAAADAVSEGRDSTMSRIRKLTTSVSPMHMMHPWGGEYFEEDLKKRAKSSVEEGDL